MREVASLIGPSSNQPIKVQAIALRHVQKQYMGKRIPTVEAADPLDVGPQVPCMPEARVYQLCPTLLASATLLLQTNSEPGASEARGSLRIGTMILISLTPQIPLPFKVLATR